MAIPTTITPFCLETAEEREAKLKTMIDEKMKMMTDQDIIKKRLAIRREIILTYSPVTGNEDKIKKELATRLAAEVAKNPKMTADEKKALEEKLKADLDGEIKMATDCIPTMTEEEIRKRKAEIRKEIEAEIGISLSDESLILNEVDRRLRAEELEHCMESLTCAPATAAPKVK